MDWELAPFEGLVLPLVNQDKCWWASSRKKTIERMVFISLENERTTLQRHNIYLRLLSLGLRNCCEQPGFCLCFMLE